MLPRSFLLSLLLVSIGFAAAISVSPDGSCGNSTAYTCADSGFGGCCSQFGWCGSTDSHCGTGCQSSYGSCSASATTTFTTKTSKITSKAVTNTSTATVSMPLGDCLGARSVPIYLPSGAQYSQRAKPYNLRLAYEPVIIVLPATTQHISDAVICAGKSNVKVQAKSGGHSYASFSTGGKNGSLIIDMETFQTINVASSGIAKVGGGVRLGNLATALYNNGKRATSHGTCPGVGIGGHFTHGGYGFSSRAWGLAMDNIVGLDVVLANGTAVHASSTTQSDLYYALRGAADSFGIVTTFYIKTRAAPSQVTNWSFLLPNVFISGKVFAKTFLAIQSFTQDASIINRNLGFNIYLDGYSFNFRGTYLGPISTFNAIILPSILRILPPGSSQTISQTTWLQSLAILAGTEPLSQSPTNYVQHDSFFAKSLVVPTSTPLTKAALIAYYNHFTTSAAAFDELENDGAGWFAIFDLYGGPDSQINNPSSEAAAAAYPLRSSLWTIQQYGFVATSTETFPMATIQPFVEGLNSAIIDAMPQASFAAYANYMDPSLTSEVAHSLYYGADIYARLVALKQELDPVMVFWNPLGVGT